MARTKVFATSLRGQGSGQGNCPPSWDSLLLAGCQPKARIVSDRRTSPSNLAVRRDLPPQQIERRLHVKVERKFQIGGTMLAHEALVKGDIDLYPEYTGTAL